MPQYEHIITQMRSTSGMPQHEHIYSQTKCDQQAAFRNMMRNSFWQRNSGSNLGRTYVELTSNLFLNYVLHI